MFWVVPAKARTATGVTRLALLRAKYPPRTRWRCQVRLPWYDLQNVRCERGAWHLGDHVFLAKRWDGTAFTAEEIAVIITMPIWATWYVRLVAWRRRLWRRRMTWLLRGLWALSAIIDIRLAAESLEAKRYGIAGAWLGVSLVVIYAAARARWPGEPRE